MRMQLPLTPHRVRGAWIIEDATGARIATLPISGLNDADVEADARQLAQAANALDALVAAYRIAIRLAEGKQ